jgi:hypothetical protein
MFKECVAVASYLKQIAKKSRCLWGSYSERLQTHSLRCHSPGFSAKTIQITKPLIADQIGLEIIVFI